jgi:hypothetical protein
MGRLVFVVVSAEEAGIDGDERRREDALAEEVLE